ncbi:hypothetical protein Tco_0189767 [Tanacetum coccineum]
MHNEDLHTELEYYSEEYVEEREMELRPARVGKTTHVFQTRSPRAQRQRGRVLEFEDALNRDGSRMERESEDGLKMPSHAGSYDGKRDPNNYLHLFDGAIRMQKWAMPVACHMFIYTLKDYTRISCNGQKAGSVVNYKDLKVKFQSHFSQQKRFTKTHLVVHNIKQRDGESTRAFVTRYTDDTLQILRLHEEQRISGFAGLKTRSLVEFLSVRNREKTRPLLKYVACRSS